MHLPVDVDMYSVCKSTYKYWSVGQITFVIYDKPRNVNHLRRIPQSWIGINNYGLSLSLSVCVSWREEGIVYLSIACLQPESVYQEMYLRHPMRLYKYEAVILSQNGIEYQHKSTKHYQKTRLTQQSVFLQDQLQFI